MEENGAIKADLTPEEFLRLKHTYIFDLLYDLTHDRNLSRQDFSKLQKVLSEIQGRAERRETTPPVSTRLGAVWAGLLKATKEYRRNALQKHVSLSEWLEYWADFIRAARKAERKWPEATENSRVDYAWHTDFMDLVFDIMDAKGDGVVDKGEHSNFLTAFGVSLQCCVEAFSRLSAVSGQGLDKVTFSDLWLQFLTSTDPSDPGNFLFGDPAMSPFPDVTSQAT